MKIPTSSLRYLLYIEWGLLLITLVAVSLPPLLFSQHSHIQVLDVLFLALFGCMGLRLPSRSQGYKVLYTGVELSLLLIWATLGGHLWLLQLLYLIVVIRSCFLFELPGRSIVAGLVLSLISVQKMQQAYSLYLSLPRREQEQFWLSQASEILWFGVVLLLLLQLVNTTLAQRQTRERLSVVCQQLRRYSRQQEELVVLREHNRMAHEIHDALGHALAALNIQLQSALKLWTIDSAQSQLFLAQAQQLGVTTMQEVRQAVRALRVDVLTDQSLATFIKNLVEDFYQDTSVSSTIHIGLSNVWLRQVVITLYQIVQPALIQICKHAQTTQLQIQISATKENAYLTIQGNARRDRLNLNTTEFKLQGVQKRVADLKGNFSLETQPEGGYRITIELPFQEVLT